MAVKKDTVIKPETVEVIGDTKYLELEAQNKSLQEQMLKQMEMIEKLMSAKPEVIAQPTINPHDPDRRLTVVYLQQPSEGLHTPIDIGTKYMEFSMYGEEWMIRFEEFPILLSKYRSYFKEGILSLSHSDMDLVTEYKLTCVDDVALKSHHIQNLPNLEIDELEKIYDKVSANQKLIITRLWSSGYYENVDSRFVDRRKIEMLNHKTNGAMQNILDDLDTNNRK